MGRRKRRGEVKKGGQKGGEEKAEVEKVGEKEVRGRVCRRERKRKSG